MTIPDTGFDTDMSIKEKPNFWQKASIRHIM